MNYKTEESITQFIESALKEDVGPGDYSSLAAIPLVAQNTAQLVMKDSGIIAGTELAKKIFAQVDPSLAIDF